MKKSIHPLHKLWLFLRPSIPSWGGGFVDPRVNLFVRRNREPVARSDRIEIKKKKLHVHRAMAEDSGMYNCLAKNDAGSSPKMESFPLIVSSNETASVKVVPRDLIAKRGEPAVLHCVFEDADSVQWFFKDMGPLETDDERTVFENGTLVIRSAEHRDQGFYSCHGDRGESTISYTVDLQIACKG